MNRYYNPAPLMFATSEKVKYSDLSIEQLETEISLLNYKKNRLRSEIGSIKYHKELINTVIDEINQEMNKADDFLLKNSSVHNHIFYDYLEEGQSCRVYKEWHWNTNDKNKLGILLQEYQDHFKTSFHYLRFLKILYNEFLVEINLNNGSYQSEYKNIFEIRKIENKDFAPLNKKILDKIKKLADAKDIKYSNVIKINLGHTSPAGGGIDKKILDSWIKLMMRNHFSHITWDRWPDYLPFKTSGKTEHEKPGFIENWAKPLAGAFGVPNMGPIDQNKLADMEEDRKWFYSKGWMPENGYKYDASKGMHHNVTPMAIRELRIKFFGYQFDENINLLTGVGEEDYKARFIKNYPSGETDSHTHPMQVNIFNSDKELKSIADGRIEGSIDPKLRKLELLLRAKIKGKKKFDDTGIIYVLSNPAYKDPFLYKIGSTYQLVEERVEQLNAETGVAHPFKLEFKVKIKDAEYYEKTTHKLLKNFRFRKNKEYFDLNLKTIKDVLKSVSDLSDNGKKKIQLQALQKKIKF
jgi:hypothetical protein